MFQTHLVLSVTIIRSPKSTAKKHRGSHFGTNQWRRHAIGPGGAVGARMMVGVVSGAIRILRDWWQIYDIYIYTGWWFQTFLFSMYNYYMGCNPNPIDELHHFSRWLVYHQPDEFSFILIDLIDSDDILIIFMINSLMFLLHWKSLPLGIRWGTKTAQNGNLT